MKIRFRKLSWRIAAWFAAILLVLQLGGLTLFERIGRASALDAVRAELEIGERVFARLLDQRRDQLALAARVLAADFGFRSALLTGDRDTIESALQNHGSRIDASLMLLLGLDEAAIARYPDIGDYQLKQLSPLIEEARTRGTAGGFRQAAGALYQVVVVPVLAPIPVAWVVVGFVVDDVLAEDLKRLTGLEVSFVNDAASAAAVVASTLEGEPKSALNEALTLFRGQGAVGLIDGVEYFGRVFEVETLASEGVRAVLQISLSRALEPWQRLYGQWAAWSVGALALMLVVSLWLGRTIAAPVSHLAMFARRLEAGEYVSPPSASRDDEIGRLTDAFGVMSQAIAEREARISELAYRDALTGLPNRVDFAERLGHALQDARAASAPLAVLSLDIDRFKLVNDTLGHRFGDLLLQEIAGRLSQAGAREHGAEGGKANSLAASVAARLGGDEFAIIVPNADAAVAQVVADRIASVLEQPMSIEGQMVDVAASIGVALYPEHGEDAGALLRAADVAMNQAKRHHSAVAFYDPAHDERNAARLSLLSELRQAVEHNELVLYYQPKHALRPDLGLHAEALVRWIHPTRGFVPPMDFIPFAEQTGYIKTITVWVIEQALRQVGEWMRAGHAVHVGLNISARDLLQPDLPERFAAMLKQYDCDPRLITLEITESAVLDDPTHALANLERLRATGCSLSIDDYGTGYSSLSYVRQMPVHELKIDRSFVMGITERPGDEIIVRSTIELAHDMGLQVTAEGVETEAVLTRLTELGCDLAQGYLISRPVPASALTAWLESKGERSALIKR